MVHQIASFKPTFSKKLRLSRGAHPPQTLPCVAQARRPALTRHFLLPKIWPLHFENHSAAYGSHHDIKGYFDDVIPSLLLISSLFIPNIFIIYSRIYSLSSSFIFCLFLHPSHLFQMSVLSLTIIPSFDYVTSFLFLISSFFVVHSLILSPFHHISPIPAFPLLLTFPDLP